MDGGSDADTFKQVRRNETNAKVADVRLGDQGIAVLGENQGIDPGSNEIVEQIAGVIGCGAHGDGWPQGAVIISDGGSQAVDTLPNTTDIHGRNSSSEVWT